MMWNTLMEVGMEILGIKVFIVPVFMFLIPARRNPHEE
jgi:hypothetical protein